MSVSETAHGVDGSNGGTDADPGRRTIHNGLLGGAVGLLLTVLPLSTPLGGAVAGYRERGHGRRGVLAGAIAGLVATVPYVAVAAWLVISPASPPAPELGLPTDLLVVLALAVAVGYSVGLAVLGSLLGGAIRD
jgi:MFS family permease